MENKYFLWDFSYETPEFIMLGFSEKNIGMTSGHVRRAYSNNIRGPIIFFEDDYTKDQVIQYNQISCPSGFLVDDNMKQVLLSIDTDSIKFIPAKIELIDGALLNYYVINVIKELDVLDRERTTFRHILGDNDSPLIPVKKVFDISKLTNEKIGTIKGVYTGDIIVNHEIVQALEKFRGPGFIPINPNEMY